MSFFHAVYFWNKCGAIKKIFQGLSWLIKPPCCSALDLVKILQFFSGNNMLCSLYKTLQKFCYTGPMPGAIQYEIFWPDFWLVKASMCEVAKGGIIIDRWKSAKGWRKEKTHLTELSSLSCANTTCIPPLPPISYSFLIYCSWILLHALQYLSKAVSISAQWLLHGPPAIIALF